MTTGKRTTPARLYPGRPGKYPQKQEDMRHNDMGFKKMSANGKKKSVYFSILPYPCQLFLKNFLLK
jgi:hypothetical protein